jgi:hypothetical protein
VKDRQTIASCSALGKHPNVSSTSLLDRRLFGMEPMKGRREREGMRTPALSGGGRRPARGGHRAGSRRPRR